MNRNDTDKTKDYTIREAEHDEGERVDEKEGWLSSRRRADRARGARGSSRSPYLPPGMRKSAIDDRRTMSAASLMPAAETATGRSSTSCSTSCACSPWSGVTYRPSSISSRRRAAAPLPPLRRPSSRHGLGVPTLEPLDDLARFVLGRDEGAGAGGSRRGVRSEVDVADEGVGERLGVVTRTRREAGREVPRRRAGWAWTLRAEVAGQSGSQRARKKGEEKLRTVAGRTEARA